LHGDSGSLRATTVEKMTGSGDYVGDGGAFVRWRPGSLDGNSQDR
jgi:hypothetical protein